MHTPPAASCLAARQWPAWPAWPANQDGGSGPPKKSRRRTARPSPARPAARAEALPPLRRLIQGPQDRPETADAGRLTSCNHAARELRSVTTCGGSYPGQPYPAGRKQTLGWAGRGGGGQGTGRAATNKLQRKQGESLRKAREWDRAHWCGGEPEAKELKQHSERAASPVSRPITLPSEGPFGPTDS